MRYEAEEFMNEFSIAVPLEVNCVGEMGSGRLGKITLKACAYIYARILGWPWIDPDPLSF